METMLNKNLLEMVYDEPGKGIDSAILYLALIPDKKKAEKMWGWLLNKKLEQRKYLIALYEFSENEEEKGANLKKVRDFTRRLLGDVEQVKEILNIEVDLEHLSGYVDWYTNVEENPKFINALSGGKYIKGARMLRELNEQQAGYLYDKLTEFQFIEGEKEHFVEMLKGKGVVTDRFKPITWLEGNKGALRGLIWGRSEKKLKITEGIGFDGMKEANIPGIAKTFFIDRKGNKCSAPKKFKYDANIEHRLNMIYNMLENLATL